MKIRKTGLIAQQPTTLEVLDAESNVATLYTDNQGDVWLLGGLRDQDDRGRRPLFECRGGRFHNVKFVKPTNLFAPFFKYEGSLSLSND